MSAIANDVRASPAKRSADSSAERATKNLVVGVTVTVTVAGAAPGGGSSSPVTVFRVIVLPETETTVPVTRVGAGGGGGKMSTTTASKGSDAPEDAGGVFMPNTCTKEPGVSAAAVTAAPPSKKEVVAVTSTVTVPPSLVVKVRTPPVNDLTVPASARKTMSTAAAVGVGGVGVVVEVVVGGVEVVVDGSAIDAARVAPAVVVDPGIVVVVAGAGIWGSARNTTTNSPTDTPLGATGDPVSWNVVDDVVRISCVTPARSVMVKLPAETAVTVPRRT